MENSTNNNSPVRAKKGVDKPNYTQVPNKFIDEVCPTLLPGQAWLLIWLARQTFGWHKESVTTSIPGIVKGTGMSERSIQGFIQSLVDLGHVEVDENWNNKVRLPSTYRLVINGADPAPGVAQEDRQGGADPAPGGGADLAPVSLEINTTKEKTNTAADSNSETQPTNPFDPEDDLIGDGRRGFIANAYRRNRRPAPKLHTRANERLVASLRAAEDRYGIEEFRGALLRYLESDSDWLRKNGWPLYKFLKDLDQDGTPQQPGLLANCPALDTAPPPTQEPSEKIRLIKLWNSAIPERAFTDPEYHLKLHPEHAQMCEKLEAVFRKAADVVRGGSDCSWLNLRWICGEKDGYPNWRKLLSGALDFKAQKKTAGRGYSTVTPESLREHIASQRKSANEQKQSNERAKELGLDVSTNRF